MMFSDPPSVGQRQCDPTVSAGVGTSTSSTRFSDFRAESFSHGAKIRGALRINGRKSGERLATTPPNRAAAKPQQIKTGGGGGRSCLKFSRKKCDAGFGCHHHSLSQVVHEDEDVLLLRFPAPFLLRLTHKFLLVSRRRQEAKSFVSVLWQLQLCDASFTGNIKRTAAAARGSRRIQHPHRQQLLVLNSGIFIRFCFI